MTLGLLCASHTPLMDHADPGEAARHAVQAGFETLARWFDAFAPELVIAFGPDHFNGFFYDLMPPFCVGVRARGAGDWGLPAKALDVPQPEAAALHAHLLEAGVEAAVSWRMQADHGFTQLLERLAGGIDAVPVIPVFINCAAPPLPTFRRTRVLGRLAGEFALGLERRVLLLGSGGLSHDPPVPTLTGASPEVAEFLIGGRNPSPAARAAREQRVRRAGRDFAAGAPQFVPLDPDWDRAFLELIRSGELAAADRYDAQQVSAVAGRGGHEVRTWLAAAAALSAAGPSEARAELYRPIPEWIAGFAMLRGRTLRGAAPPL